MSTTTDLEVVSIKGEGAADQGVENDPQTPDIHLRSIVLLPLEQLRGSVGRTATERVQLAAWSELIAEPKVGYLDVHVGIQQQVFSL